jgi:hypothetical protein
MAKRRMARSDPRLSSEEAPIDPDLSAQARARVEAERALAEVEFVSAYRNLKAGSDQEFLRQAEGLLAAYIHHVFFAFAEEALNSGWPAETVRKKTAQFLPLLVDRTFFVKHPRARVIDRDTHRARFQDWAVFAVLNSDSWVEFQKALAELAQRDTRRRRWPMKPQAPQPTPDGNQGEKMVPRADESAAVPPQKNEAANSRGGAGEDLRAAEAEVDHIRASTEAAASGTSPASVATEPSEPVEQNEESTAELAQRRRGEIYAFMRRVFETTRRQIFKKDIWTAAGYSDRTEFERFQRGDAHTTASAAANFERVLKMEPKLFVELLDRLRLSKQATE